MTALDGLKLAHASLGKLLDKQNETDLRIARFVLQATINMLEDLVQTMDEHLGDVN